MEMREKIASELKAAMKGQILRVGRCQRRHVVESKDETFGQIVRRFRCDTCQILPVFALHLVPDFAARHRIRGRSGLQTQGGSVRDEAAASGPDGPGPHTFSGRTR